MNINTEEKIKIKMNMIINIITEYDSDELKKIGITELKIGITELKKIAQSLKVPRYSAYKSEKKHELIELIIDFLKDKHKDKHKDKSNKMVKSDHINEDEIKHTFMKQVIRKDVLINMLINSKIPGHKLFELVINENNSDPDKIRQGWLFETISQILIVLKCITNINYTQLYEGKLDNLKIIENINHVLNLKIAGQGANKADFVIKDHNTLIPFSIKYKEEYNRETDVVHINDTIREGNITDDFKIGLIVKDKQLIIEHKYKNNKDNDKIHHDKIIKNCLLFDKKDIIKALDVFSNRFSNIKINIDDFIDFINKEYISSPRKQLIPKLHQKMALLKFIKSTIETNNKIWCISHKPRSGKTITMLIMSKYLLEQKGYTKILIMTSVPDTINNFKEALDTYIDFKNIKYKSQDAFNTVDHTFNGITFCSIQYLKTVDGKKKKDMLKKIGFEVVFTDECHLGGSTDKTKKDILDVESDIVNDIRKNIKLNIFASGTSNKTRKYYNIKESSNFEWEIEDESYMKKLYLSNEEDKESIIQYMVNRHSNTFKECFYDETLNKDYSKHPTQVLLKHTIPESLITEINTYNQKNNTTFGYSCSSLFALRQTKNNKGEVVYSDDLELSCDNDGIELLKKFFSCIISNERMEKNTMMKHIENTQTVRGSRKSTIENPLLFIIFLPTHTRNNTISKLQPTLKKFLEENGLWSDYNIEYSNSIEDSGDSKEDYNEYIKTIMKHTKDKKKRGCILLLGDKGTVGITYKYCDVTISLDDGHNLDNQKQRFSRALTEMDGKTIGINIDMNIQRTYTYLIDVIHRYRKNTKTTMTNAEILYYLFKQNIFLFDPHQFNNGDITIKEITSYYEKEANNIMKEIDDTFLLESIVCDDGMRNLIKTNMTFKKVEAREINKDLEGEQQECPKGEKTGIAVDSPDKDDKERDDCATTDEESEKVEILINKTYEICKGFLFPLLAVISKSYKIFDFKDILVYKETFLFDLIKDKIELNIDNYYIMVKIMNEIIDNNEEIVNNIREIYRLASPTKLRELIAKHFIPSNEEKKKNAEVPTPPSLVNDMLDKIPIDFWETPKKVFEPCCGKGNFVLGIFDRFYFGLEEIYPDKIERCEVIMKECIYYADLTSLNVFITTEIMKCHVQYYTKVDDIDNMYEFECDYDSVFNKHVGDTLKLDIKDKWGLDGFDAVIGNPPYNNSQNNTGKKGGGDLLWNKFVEKSLNEYLVDKGKLLYVHPSGWRKPESSKSKYQGLFKLMTSENQMNYLEIHGINDGMKTFNCGTRYDWYIIEKTPIYKNTIIKCQTGDIYSQNLSKWSFLPNENLDLIYKLINNDNGEESNIIYSRNNYGSDKKWVSSIKNEEFKYPLVHSTPKAGIRYMYSNINTNGHFNISKIIFGESGIYNAIIDMEGKYGMTQGAMAIQVDSLEEGENIKKTLESSEFKKVLESCSWSNFRIDWRLFTYFKKDFWKEFI